MSGIHNEVLKKLKTELQKALIDDIALDDPARAGVVMIGPLQGNPDPDVARISVTLHENDPEAMLGKEVGGNRSSWDDEVEEIEVGGCITWKRRFTVKARCLLEQSRETLDDARDITSTIRSRIEVALLKLKFAGVASPTEYVSMGVYSENITGEMVQSGGPDAYDFHVKIRFEILTTTVIGE